MQYIRLSVDVQWMTFSPSTNLGQVRLQLVRGNPEAPKIRIPRSLNHDMDEPGLANVTNATGRLTGDSGTWCSLQRPLIDLHP
jgi:hypothetical protein